MTDDELIERFERMKLVTESWESWRQVEKDYARLIALARIGASVMPRPIDDDAKNGEPMLCWCDMQGVKFVQVLTYDRVTPIHPWYDQEGVGYHAGVPLHYVPAKALPKPQVKP